MNPLMRQANPLTRRGFLAGSAAAIAASWAALTLGLGAAILSRAGTHRRVASGSRPIELAAWQTPTPVAGVVAARRPAVVAKEAP